MAETKQCQQLRFMLITQERMLESAERELSRDELKIQKLKDAIDKTVRDLGANGCL